jgi:hypothetical protein
MMTNTNNAVAKVAEKLYVYLAPVYAYAERLVELELLPVYPVELYELEPKQTLKYLGILHRSKPKHILTV